MNVINEMPDDIYARKQYRLYRRWVPIGFCLGFAPFVAVLVAAAFGWVDKLLSPLLVVVMMILSLGMLATGFMYWLGLRPARAQLNKKDRKRE